MKQISLAITKKIYLIIYLLCIAFVIISGRLFYLQVHLNTDLLLRSQKNFLRTEEIPSLRGNIVDTHGKLLATNRPAIHLYWQGSGNRTINQDQQHVLLHISQILEKEISHEQITEINAAERSKKKTLLASDVPFEKLSKILEAFPDTQNLSIISDFKRFYPHQDLACHILGYLGTINLKKAGLMGLEKIFDEKLHGEYGTLMKKINSIGTSFHEQELKKALAGEDIKTTIDLELQKIVEAALPENVSAVVILLDPKTGAVRATVSRPSFYPEVFLNPIAPDTWNSMIQVQPFINRAFEACYPPGSIFKLVTISAALERGIIDQEGSWYCKGYMRFGRRRFHCANRKGHGKLTTEGAVAKSCNIPLYEIAKRLPIDTIAEYAAKFGLGKKTNIIFPEKKGLIPTQEWKRSVIGEPWWPGETLSAAIGQSYLLVTPLQIACMVSSIFEGYLVRPRMLELEEINRETLTIAPATREFLIKAMRAVATEGTAIKIGKIRDINVFAKTSTAQTREYIEDSPDNYTYHLWLASYFQYKESEPLTLVVLMEHAEKPGAAATIAKRILINYRNLMEERITS